uniref:C2H2-type domain-containing protein n=1 Tax=Ditylenchus dipsaci TaxID=166011 RepID=A0A915D0T3_9BILA
MPEDSAASVLSSMHKAKPDDPEDQLDNDGTSNLRRSKRRNKFHLDMAAMLSGNNPDRRLSPSPPPKGSSLLNHMKLAKLPSTSTSSLGVKHTHATRKHSPAVSDSASSDTVIHLKVAKSKSPRVVRPPIDKVEQKGDSNSNHLEIDVAGKKETGKGSAALAKSVSPKHTGQCKKGAGEGRGAHWKKKAASTETDVLKSVISSLAETSKLDPVVEAVLKDRPKPEVNSELCTSKPSEPEPDVKKLTFCEFIKEPDAVCSNEAVIERKTSSSTSTEPNISGKRKRKVPLRHSDFTLQDRDSDQDEVLFKSAKIEYTNVDGSKSLDDFSCTKCPAQFESRVGLTNHMKLHGAQKQFPCEHCDFCCTNKKTMRQHRRIHGIHKKQGGRASPLKGVKGGLVNSFSLTLSPPPNLTTTSNVVKSPTTLAEMQPKMRAIDMALKLNLDEDGNPKPVLLAVETAEHKGVPINETIVTPLKVSEGRAVEIEGGFDEAMPVLFREEHLSAKKNEQIHTVICRKDPDNTSDAPVSSRKSVKCPECPFRTRSQARLQPHLVGHSRKSGFLCPLCNFKSESAGFLKRHCDLHKADYKWPPDYVGIPQEQLDTLLAKERDRIEQESVAAAAAALLSSGGDVTASCKVKPRRLFSASSASPIVQTNSGVPDEALQANFLQCPVNECGFRSQFKMEVVCHELKSHKDKFKQKKFPKGWPSPLTCKNVALVYWAEEIFIFTPCCTIH